MNSSIIIRPFIDADANDISSIIIDCIKNLSNEFYDTQAIDTLCLFYTPQHILYYSKLDNIFIRAATANKNSFGILSL